MIDPPSNLLKAVSVEFDLLTRDSKKKVYASSDDDITNNKRRTNCGGPDNDGDDDWALMNITATTH